MMAVAAPASVALRKLEEVDATSGMVVVVAVAVAAVAAEWSSAAKFLWRYSYQESQSCQRRGPLAPAVVLATAQRVLPNFPLHRSSG